MIKITAVVETFRKISPLPGGLKLVVIQSSAACASGHTIDLNTDVADAKGQVVKEILLTLVQDDAGADKDGTFDPATGIYTLGTITTGIHNIMFVAR